LIPHTQNGHASRRQLLDRDHQVPQVAAKPVKLPTHADVNAPGISIRHQLVESGPAEPEVPVSTYSAGGRAAGLAVAPEFEELVLAAVSPKKCCHVSCANVHRHGKCRQ
jgi:hypothetical protein